MVMDISAIPLNMTVIMVTNKAPKNIPPSSTVSRLILVRKKRVIAITAIMKSWLSLKIYTKEFLLISKTSLAKQALKSSIFPTPYFLVAKAAG
uniref:Uncharacterized protein n=1 Tax=Rhizophora mucronata TaxID=61149 RepID=A0A2P2IUZ9_RHIMU